MATAAIISLPIFWNSLGNAGPSTNIVSIGDETAHGRAQVFSHRAGECHQHQGATRDYEPGIDLLALDHIAALESFLKTFLGRFFRFVFVFVELLGHAHSRSAARKVGKDALEIPDKRPHHRANHQHRT
jgi:hypothetical protein